MTRIALIPWVEGHRRAGGWTAGYTADRVRWIVEQFVKATQTLPLYVATPHMDADLGPARKIDCSKFLKRGRLYECGVMATTFHTDLMHLDIDAITADTLVLRDPREVMGERWCAPQQHLPESRPYGDWFSYYPAWHQLRHLLLDHFLRDPHRAAKFDREIIRVARAHDFSPKLILPPTIINGEWIAEGWEGWSQPITEQTAAVHPHSHTKFPEFADAHPWLEVLKPRFSEPVPAVNWPELPDVPTELT